MYTSKSEYSYWRHTSIQFFKTSLCGGDKSAKLTDQSSDYKEYEEEEGGGGGG
jgi:hypothetical protein